MKRLKKIWHRILISWSRYRVNKAGNRIVKETFNGLDEQREFELWAVGESPHEYCINTMHAWNSRHGELYFARSDEDVAASLSKMKAIWLGEKYIKLKTNGDK